MEEIAFVIGVVLCKATLISLLVLAMVKTLPKTKKEACVTEEKSLKLSLLGLTEKERKRVLEYSWCLKKSPITEGGEEYVFGGVASTRDAFFVTLNPCIGIGYRDKITLPLSTLKVCPYMAVKYRIIMMGETSRSKWVGRINEIDCLGNFSIWRGRDKPSSKADMKFKAQDLLLDYNSLPKGVTLC